MERVLKEEEKFDSQAHISYDSLPISVVPLFVKPLP